MFSEDELKEKNTIKKDKYDSHNKDETKFNLKPKFNDQGTKFVFQKYNSNEVSYKKKH